MEARLARRQSIGSGCFIMQENVFPRGQAEFDDFGGNSAKAG
jgi:hypothetical protein